MKARFFSAVLAAMILATASVGVTASAAETTETLSEATEEITETSADTVEDENSAVEPETETSWTTVKKVDKQSRKKLQSFKIIR